MFYKTALMTECLITSCTTVTVLISMYVLMGYQTAFMNECFIRYCTDLMAITTIYALMFYQIALLTEPLITYCTAVRAITTIYVGALSDRTSASIPYYAPQSYKGDHYVCVDELSECPFD